MALFGKRDADAPLLSHVAQLDVNDCGEVLEFIRRRWPHRYQLLANPDIEEARRRQLLDTDRRVFTLAQEVMATLFERRLITPAQKDELNQVLQTGVTGTLRRSSVLLDGALQTPVDTLSLESLREYTPEPKADTVLEVRSLILNPKVDDGLRLCPICHHLFVPLRRDAGFCSFRCGNLASLRKARAAV